MSTKLVLDLVKYTSARLFKVTLSFYFDTLKAAVIEQMLRKLRTFVQDPSPAHHLTSRESLLEVKCSCPSHDLPTAKTICLQGSHYHDQLNI